MNNEKHARIWISLIFLKVSVTVGINQILVSICRKLVFFVAVEERFFDFTDEDGMLFFFSVPDDHGRIRRIFR